MTKKLLKGMILSICIFIASAAVLVVIVGLEIILTQSYHAYAQWMDPAELNEIYHNTGHSNSGFIADDNDNQTNTHK